MTTTADFDLPMEDGVVFEPPSLSEACDPRGEPCETQAPPGPRRAHRWPLVVAIVGAAVAASSALALATAQRYAVSWLEDDGSVSISDVRWSTESQLPIERVSLRLQGENLDVLEYEITPQPRFLPLIAPETE